MLAEDDNAATKRLVGNFPQVSSRATLVTAAQNTFIQ
jgi:hypothetical protein